MKGGRCDSKLRGVVCNSLTLESITGGDEFEGVLGLLQDYTLNTNI